MSTNTASKGRANNTRKSTSKNSTRKTTTSGKSRGKGKGKSEGKGKGKGKKKRKASFFKKMKTKTKKKLKKMFLRKWNEFKSIDFKYRPEEAKVFSNTCNFMTLSLVSLVVLFVYIESSLFYTVPLVTVLYIFVKYARGNRYKNSSKRDLILYRKILLINLFVFSAIYYHYYDDLWFINIFAFSIFLVPLSIARFSK